jgi:hypothetical protein
MKLNEISSGQKVWSVYYSEQYEGSILYGIFSTKKAAQNAIAKLVKEDDSNKEDDYSIGEIIVNKLYDGLSLLR